MAERPVQTAGRSVEQFTFPLTYPIPYPYYTLSRRNQAAANRRIPMLKSFLASLVSALALVSSIAGAQTPHHSAAPMVAPAGMVCRAAELVQGGRVGETYQVCLPVAKAAPVRRLVGSTTFRVGVLIPGPVLGGVGHDAQAPRVGHTTVIARAGR